MPEGYLQQIEFEMAQRKYERTEEFAAEQARSMLAKSKVDQWKSLMDKAKEYKFSDSQSHQVEQAYINRLFKDEKFAELPTYKQQETLDAIRTESARRGIYISQPTSVIQALPKGEQAVMNYSLQALNLFNIPRAVSEQGLGTALLGPYKAGFPTKSNSDDVVREVESGNLSKVMDALDSFKAETKPPFHDPSEVGRMAGSVVRMTGEFVPAVGVARMIYPAKFGRQAFRSAITLGLLPWFQAPSKGELEKPGEALAGRAKESLKGAALGGVAGKLSNLSPWIRVPSMATLFSGTTYADSRFLQNKSVTEATNDAASSIMTLMAFQLTRGLMKPWEMEADIRRVNEGLAKRLHKQLKMPLKDARDFARITSKQTDGLFRANTVGLIRSLELEQLTGAMTEPRTKLLRDVKMRAPKMFKQLGEMYPPLQRRWRKYADEDYLMKAVTDKIQSMKEYEELDDQYYLDLAKQMMGEKIVETEPTGPGKFRLKKPVAKEITTAETLAARLKVDTEKAFNAIATRVQAATIRATDEVAESPGFKQKFRRTAALPEEAQRGQPGRRGKIRAWMNEKSEKPESLLLQMFGMNENSVGLEMLYTRPYIGRMIRDNFIMTMEGYVTKEMKQAGVTGADVQTWSRAMSPWLTRAGAKVKFGPTAPTTSFKLSNGQTVNMTRAEMLDMHMNSIHPHNREALLGKNGWYLSGTKMKRIKGADVDMITSKLTPKELALADIATAVQQMSGEFGNIASIKMDGKRKFVVDPYWPVKRRDMPMRTFGKKSTLYLNIEGRTPFHKRVGGTYPIEVGDFFTNLHNSITDMAAYGGLAEPIRNAKLMLSDRGFNDMVRARGGANALPAIRSYLERMEDNSYLRTPVGDVFSKMLNRGVRSIIGLHPGISAKQFLSFFLIGTEMDAKYMWQTGPTVVGRKDMQEMTEWNPMLAVRFKHGRVTREAGDLGQTGVVRRTFAGKRGLDDYSTWLLRSFDKESIGRIHKAVKLETADKFPNLKPGSPEYIKHVVDRENTIIRRTQPTWDAGDRSEIGGSRSPLSRLYTIFHSQRETTVGIMNRANMQYRVDGDFSKLVKNYKYVLVNSAMFAAVDYLLYRGLYQREVNPMDIVTRTAENVVGLPYLIDIAGRTMIRAVEAAFKGREYPSITPGETIPINMLEHAGRSFYYLEKHLEHRGTSERFDSGPNRGMLKSTVYAWRAGEEIAVTASRILGIPFEAPMRVFKGGKKAYKEAVKVPRI